MAKYSINDFKKGDTVYHLSNTKLKMVVIEVRNDMNEVSCRWVDAAGKIQVLDFMAEELGKGSDLGPKVFSI